MFVIERVIVIPHLRQADKGGVNTLRSQGPVVAARLRRQKGECAVSGKAVCMIEFIVNKERKDHRQA